MLPKSKDKAFFSDGKELSQFLSEKLGKNLDELRCTQDK